MASGLGHRRAAAALLLPVLATASGSAPPQRAWTFYPDTACGCAEGNSRNWPPSNPDGHGELGTFWAAAPRDDVQVCQLLCDRDPECHGFQWTAVSNQIPERDVCWFRKDAACEPSPPSVCGARQCEAAPERDCYVKPPPSRAAQMPQRQQQQRQQPQWQRQGRKKTQPHLFMLIVDGE